MSDNYRFSNFEQFLTNSSQGEWNTKKTKTIAETNFGQIWGSGRFRKLVRGKRVRKPKSHSERTWGGVAGELPGEVAGELPGKSGDFPESEVSKRGWREGVGA